MPVHKCGPIWCVCCGKDNGTCTMNITYSFTLPLPTPPPPPPPPPPLRVPDPKVPNLMRYHDLLTMNQVMNNYDLMTYYIGFHAVMHLRFSFKKGTSRPLKTARGHATSCSLHIDDLVLSITKTKKKNGEASEKSYTVRIILTFNRKLYGSKMMKLVVLRKRHPSSGSPSLSARVVGQIQRKYCRMQLKQPPLSTAAQCMPPYSTFCIQEIQFAHLVFAKEECLQTAILGKNMAKNYTIHIPEIHLKSIFSNTQHFYRLCMLHVLLRPSAAQHLPWL